MWRCPLKELDPKVPKGPRRGREIPLIGVADVSLRGLGSPKEGEQKTFWSPSFVMVGFALDDGEGAVELLDENCPDHLVGKGHLR